MTTRAEELIIDALALSSPVFACVFADGESVRMSCWHNEGRVTLDLRRGLKLARSAYVTRMHNRERSASLAPDDVTVPAIIEARFEGDGEVLEEYNAKQLTEITQ